MKEELIKNNINLIYVVLKKLKLYHKKDEYYDIGLVGLVKGVKSFDPSKGYAISTYLYKCIYNEIIMTFRKKVPEILSLDTEIYTDKCGHPLTLLDSIPSDIDIEEEIIKNEQLDLIYKEMTNLSKKEQLVLNYYFGINGYEKLKQEDIGVAVGVSQGYVCRIKNRAIKKIKLKLKK